MDKKEFCKLLNSELELEAKELTLDTNLNNLGTYDSLAVMSLVAVVDEHFNKTLDQDEIAEIKYVNDIIKLIGEDKFE